MKPVVWSVPLGLLILVTFCGVVHAKSTSEIPYGVETQPKTPPANSVEPVGVQLADHTEAEWQEFLSQRRAKKRRLRRQRARKEALRQKRNKPRRIKSRKSNKTARSTAIIKPQTNISAPLYDRIEVDFSSKEKPGTLIVKTQTRHLYYIIDEQRAIRYGVAVGKEGFAWSGTSKVKRKVEWPKWYPPKEMIRRKPSLKKWKDGQPGGPDNPLGAAALYLFQGEKDTLYRIHGTNVPSSIGSAASSGCIRMRNEDIQELYNKVSNGTKVIVH